MTTSRSVLLISLIALILAVFVPAVSALEVVYDEYLFEYIDTSESGYQTAVTQGSYELWDQYQGANVLCFKDITKTQDLRYLIIEVPGDMGHWVSNKTKIEPGRYDFTYYFNDEYRPGVLELTRKTDALGEVTSTVFTVYLNDWDIGTYTGRRVINMPFYFTYGKYVLPWRGSEIHTETNTYIAWWYEMTYWPPTILPIKITEVTGIDWKHYLKVEEHLGTYYIVVNGLIEGNSYTSDVVLKKGAVIHSQYENRGERIELSVPTSEINILEIISPSGTRYVYPLFGEGPYYPVRTVPVTMTDIDGNKISGFEVRAENAFTGESYTVSTDSDVAYITLPMDRTATVPNPQTGEYEEAPVGYYNFYGIKPGYKMVPDWAIRVNVLPEKYMPDIFCDIIVAPDIGYSRTVTVTMTDIDGNKIGGFEVKAVNTYTGESYTVSTGSDVAYITLPMDRTARVPNPQTGEYEEAPVGYYLFYGYKPGYEMVPNWGIQVNVLPEKYMPDIFCDIIVAPAGTVPDDPNNSPVYVYVRNAQTGALLADATVIIKDTRTDPWTEVVNQTVPSGQGTFYLANDPANNPNQYYITALVPGYSDIYNGRFFHVTGPIYITVYMEPIEGGPVDENNTILEFYVRDPDGNPVSDAMVYVADEARWTNAQGWIRFEVPKNAAYSYTVRKFGYATVEGSVTVGDGPRHTVNVVLTPESIPTQPPGPGEPTPTPTSGVPGDDGSEGFLSEAVRGIGKLFGVGFSTAKILLGMLLALSIGFTTAKKLRGGAAEFGLGLLGGTMLGVLVGLLPVWTIVVLLLVVGMYIGYRYVGGGNNG